jgi:N-methylhydantoinase A
VLRVGVDPGGTFTDCVLWSAVTRRLVTAKVPSRPAEPEAAVADGLARLVAAGAVEPGELTFIAHGTTIATNAVITGDLAVAGLLTNRGFRDILEIGTQQRPSLYVLHQPARHVLVPRDRRLEVGGRIAFDGSVLEPIDEAEVAAAARRLAAMGVESIAIAMLFSFVDASQEARVEAIVRDAAPGVYVTRSSAVSPELREYPRFATTAANAALAPLLDRSITSLDDALAKGGVTVPLHVMQSNGGLATAARSIGENAHRLVLSGPAAGVIGGSYVAAQAGFDQAVTLDIGGTSADIGIALASQARMRIGLTLASGLPLQIPALEVEAIGAGGGSIASVDAGGALRVGPSSAGAVPGPACYGTGGDRPTVTDAHLVLGRLDPDRFLGGEITLFPELARKAIDAHVAAPLGCSVEEAARGIIAVTEANMAGAIRQTAARNGDDLREFVLVAAGGAGPLHAVQLAAELRMRAVCVPLTPGLLSALGLLATDLRHDLAAPLLMFARDLVPSELDAAFLGLEEAAARLLAEDGVDEDDRRLERGIDLRSVGQDWTLTVPLERGEPVQAVLDRFHRQHERVYGHSAPDEPVESVAIRLVAWGAFPRPLIAPPDTERKGPDRRRRDAWFGEAGGFIATEVLDRAGIDPDEVILGPAIIEQLDTTVLVPPGYQARVIELDSLLIERVEGSA